ncbi:MAG: hypothetical protein SNJ63_01390 [Sphingomonadaceae bacterium]
MRLWLLLGALLLPWTLLAWVLFSAMRGGSRTVYDIGRSMGYAPAQTQWLAEILAEAGGAGQVVVGIVWLLGAGALGLTGLILNRR